MEDLVPAVHGPKDGERDLDSFVNCEVTVFVLSGPDLPVLTLVGTTPPSGRLCPAARAGHRPAPGPRTHGDHVARRTH